MSSGFQEGFQKERIAHAGAGVVVALGFLWRFWLAHATFFNTDEAWHYSVANQDSLLAAYKASLTLAHPPLMVVVLYFWRHLGTSDVMLRLPGVLAGSIFCWIFYQWLTLLFGRTVAWCGLIFATFLPPMIALSAELRQYSWMLMFAVAAAYFLERALADNTVGMMLLSSVCLYCAMLSHYSAFLIAVTLGLYGIVRMLSQRPATTLILSWTMGQVAGVGIAWLLYETHIAKLGRVYPVAQPLQRFGDFYLSDWYFHAGRDRLLPFLYRGTFGVFRFVFGQTAIGQVGAILFFAGILLVLLSPKNVPSARWTAVLLMIPFALNWVAVVAGLYPYGRTRQCVFLAIFALAGVSVVLARIAANRTGVAVAIALVIVALCQAFGTLQGRDMLPLADQRHEHMDQAIQLLRSEVAPDDLIFTDQATSFQLRHYLCRQQPVRVEASADGSERFRCDGFRVFSTGAGDGALTAESVASRWQGRLRSEGLTAANRVWVVQGGWASGLGEALVGRFPPFAQTKVYNFGRYLEIFQLPVPTA